MQLSPAKGELCNPSGSPALWYKDMYWNKKQRKGLVNKLILEDLNPLLLPCYTDDQKKAMREPSWKTSGKTSCWLAAHWKSRKDSMASKGNAVLNPALAPSETCSDFTLTCKGAVWTLSWCHSANEHVPFRGTERKSVLTLQDLLLFNQTKRKYQLLRIHPFISILQRTVELRCSSWACLYHEQRNSGRSMLVFSPHWSQEKICLKKNWWCFSKEVTIFLPFPDAASVLSHCSLSMVGEQVQGRRFGR